MTRDQSPSSKSLGTPALRQMIDDALDAGDVEAAQDAAAQLAQRKKLGLWEKKALGRVALTVKDHTEADRWLSQAHEILPDEGAILVDLASAKAGLRRWRQAADLLGQAIAQRADIPDLHERHGIYLANCGAGEGAINAFERALALDPNRASTWALIGERHIDAADIEAAESAFQSALKLDPDCSPALWNLALVRERAGALSAALDLLAQVPEAQAETAQARHRRGQILLSLGRLDEGWRDYAARLKNRDYVSWQYALRVSYWAGEDLSDKHLVVWADQGLGEQLLAASLLGAMAQCGRLTFACDPRLVPLLARSLPDVQVVPLTAIKDRGPTLGPIDMQATLSELGAALRPTLEDFPAPASFLKPDGARRAAFRDGLKANGRALVGLSWRSENAMAGPEKSTSLVEHWPAVFKTPNVLFVSLQYGDVSDEIAAAHAAIGAEIATVSDLDPTRDIDGYAALVAAMDAVISTSNTAVHVAGGLGVPTWAVLPQAYGRPWYWFDQGEVSPWYQNLSLIRSHGDWVTALSKAADKATDYLRAKA